MAFTPKYTVTFEGSDNSSFTGTPDSVTVGAYTAHLEPVNVGQSFEGLGHVTTSGRVFKGKIEIMCTPVGTVDNSKYDQTSDVKLELVGIFQSAYYRIADTTLPDWIDSTGQPLQAALMDAGAAGLMVELTGFDSQQDRKGTADRIKLSFVTREIL